MAATVTRRGQVTIPKRLRERLDIQPGSSVEFELSPNGRVAIFKVEPQSRAPDFTRFRGLLPQGPSTDDVMRLTRGEE